MRPAYIRPDLRYNSLAVIRGLRGWDFRSILCDINHSLASPIHLFF